MDTHISVRAPSETEKEYYEKIHLQSLLQSKDSEYEVNLAASVSPPSPSHGDRHPTTGVKYRVLAIDGGGSK